MNIRSNDPSYLFLLRNYNKQDSLFMQVTGLKDRISQMKNQQAERRLTIQVRGAHGNQKGKEKKKYLTEAEMKLINDSYSLCGGSSGVYKCGDLSFTLDQIPDLDMSKLREVKAEENILNFGKSGMFKFKAGSGEEYAVYVRETGITKPWTELLRQPASQEWVRYIAFWNGLLHSTQTMSLEYSNQEIHQYLEEAGVHQGFFTIKMGDQEVVRYYSNAKHTSIITTKEQYDKHYEGIVSGRFFGLYEPGTVIKFGGKEYVLQEDHSLNIPYGEDIYDFEAPRLNGSD